MLVYRSVPRGKIVFLFFLVGFSFTGEVQFLGYGRKGWQQKDNATLLGLLFCF